MTSIAMILASGYRNLDQFGPERSLKMRLNVTLVLKIAYALVSMVGTRAQDFSFYYLVLQWPGSRSFSRDPCCYPPDGKPMAEFLIHGLWPHRLNGTMPVHCTSEQFDINQVQSLRPMLNKHWPSMSCPGRGSVAQNPSFWEHEWTKHGTCSAMTQLEYFGSSLTLWNQLHEADFLTALRDNGIKPDDSGAAYDRTTIKQVVNDALWSVFPKRNHEASIQTYPVESSGADPLAIYIKCEYDVADPFHYQLSEIWVCLGRSDKRPIPCPVAKGDICLKEVTFHTFRDCKGLVVPRSSLTFWWSYISHLFLIFVGFLFVFAKWRCSFLSWTMSQFLTLLGGTLYIIQSRYL